MRNQLKVWCQVKHLISKNTLSFLLAIASFGTPRSIVIIIFRLINCQFVNFTLLAKHAKHALTLVRTDNTDKLILVAPSDMEKVNWMNSINDAISKYMAEELPKVKGQI